MALTLSFANSVTLPNYRGRGPQSLFAQDEGG